MIVKEGIELMKKFKFLTPIKPRIKELTIFYLNTKLCKYEAGERLIGDERKHTKRRSRIS